MIRKFVDNLREFSESFNKFRFKFVKVSSEILQKIKENF